MLIAQISDLHMTSEGAPGIGGSDPERAVEAAVEALRSLDVTPDLVICTGDISFSEKADEYDRARSLLQLLPMPFVPMVGNHDNRALLAEAFGVQRVGEFVQYVIDDFPVRIVVLDTLTPGSIHGS
jgi:3',5'-cyclic-AMP phosphodiesterase